MYFKDEQSGEVTTGLKKQLQEAEDTIEERDREIKKLKNDLENLEGVALLSLPLFSWNLCHTL